MARSLNQSLETKWESDRRCFRKSKLQQTVKRQQATFKYDTISRAYLKEIIKKEWIAGPGFKFRSSESTPHNTITM